jgi:hypothetical protein
LLPFFRTSFHLLAVQINEARNVYRGVAARGAMLFFMLNSLGKMHAFYQYSLGAFVVSKGAGGKSNMSGGAGHQS